MSDALSGFRRPPRRQAGPVTQGLLAVIAAVLVLGCGLLAGRLLANDSPAPVPSPSRSAT